MAKKDQRAEVIPFRAPDPPSSPQVRLANAPLSALAAAIGRVVTHCPYSDDAYLMHRLRELFIDAGDIGFEDFARLVEVPGGEGGGQLQQFYKDLQGKHETAIAELRSRSDELAQKTHEAEQLARALEQLNAEVEQLRAKAKK